jgi:WD40 repeat protein
VRGAAPAVALLLLLAACGGGRSGIGAADARRLVELAHGSVGGQVLSVAWSPDGGRVAAGGPRGVVVLDAGSGRRQRTLPTGGSQVWGVAWSKYGIAAASDDGVVRTWRGGHSFALEPVPGGPAFSVAWSRDGKLAAGYANGSVRIGRSTFAAHGAEVIAVAWSPDGRSLASGSIDTTIVVRGGGSASRFGRPEGADVNGLAWSPDDHRLAAANQDGAVRIWDVRKRKVALRLRGHEGWARGVAWSPNGDLVASSGADRFVRISDAATGKERATLPAGREEAWSVAWSPDGSKLASGDGDGSVRVWGLR